jgi:hypothetical protein
MTMKLSDTHLAYLKMFKPDTYGINLPYSIAKTLEIKGLVEWMPPKFGSQMWAITEKGRKAVSMAVQIPGPGYGPHQGQSRDTISEPGSAAAPPIPLSGR